VDADLHDRRPGAGGRNVRFVDIPDAVGERTPDVVSEAPPLNRERHAVRTAVPIDRVEQIELVVARREDVEALPIGSLHARDELLDAVAGSDAT